MNCISKLFMAILLSISLTSCNSQDADELSKQYGGLLAQGINGLLENAGNESSALKEVGAQSQCMKKLMPCEPYLHSPSTAPSTCCLPLKDMVADQIQCLCGVLHNAPVLKSFNITADDAVNLAKACGADPDLSLCQNSTSPSPTLAPILPLLTPSANSPSPSASPADEKNAGLRMSHMEKSTYFAFFLTFIFIVLSA